MKPNYTKTGMLAGAAMTVLLAGCGPKAPPAPLPPPKPLVLVVPPKPMPPMGASPNVALPPADATGLRYSVNRNITPAQMVWNLRSAYNVAALNCHAPRHAEIVGNYRAFLKAHEKTLAKANRTVDAEFKGKYGKGFIAPREKYMTEVYNHFALPPTMGNFCTAVLAVSRDAIGLKSADLEAFAGRSLPSIEVVFDDFYRQYDAYRLALAEWQARYAPAPVPVAVPAPLASAEPAPQAAGAGAATTARAPASGTR